MTADELASAVVHRHLGDIDSASAFEVTEAVAAAIRLVERAAEARGRKDEQRAVSVALGLRDGETLHDWIVRKQGECNRLRNEAVREAERAMKERCAKVAEQTFSQLDPGDQGFVSSVSETIAAAIRQLEDK